MAYCKVLSWSFCKKILTNLKNVGQTKVEKIDLGEKKESMEQRETNSNAS